ncbi:MAG: hypothetical protein ACFCVH_07100 [Alphaproteobacteria bacterium]
MGRAGRIEMYAAGPDDAATAVPVDRHVGRAVIGLAERQRAAAQPGGEREQEADGRAPVAHPSGVNHRRGAMGGGEPAADRGGKARPGVGAKQGGDVDGGRVRGPVRHGDRRDHRFLLPLLNLLDQKFMAE